MLIAASAVMGIFYLLYFLLQLMKTRLQSFAHVEVVLRTAFTP